MDENLQDPQNKRSYLVIGVLFGILVILIGGFLLLSSAQKRQNTGNFFSNLGNSLQGTTKLSPTPSIAPQPTLPPPPKISFDTWKTDIASPVASSSAATYTFKQNYTVEDVRMFTKKLFPPNTVTSSGKQVLAYSINPSTNDTEVVRFNTASGSFSYLSTTGYSLQPTGTTTDAIYSFLKNIDYFDPALQVTATYEDARTPGYRYYELHRDWQQMGLPVLNFVGLLNFPENQPLNSLSLSSKPSITDTNIINTSDGKNGLARQKDFNTMTIAVETLTNKIVAVDSNIRKIQSVNVQPRPLLSSADAQQILTSNKSDMIIAYPAGAGPYPWDKVFPQNIAQAQQAVITDVSYAYLEQPGYVAQSELKPYVVFRGYAPLQSGYRSDFVAAVSANQSGVLGAFTAQNISPTDTNHSGSQGNLIGPQGNPPPPVISIPSYCTNDPNDQPAPFDREFTFMGITLIHTPYTDRIDPGKPNGAFRDDNYGKGHWYYLPPADITEAKLQSDLATIAQNIDEFVNRIGGAGYKDFRMRFYRTNRETGETLFNPNGFWDGVLADFKGTACPIRLTGGSPTIFVYGNPGQKLTIESKSSLTYTDPDVTTGSWNVIVNSDGLLVNDVKRDYIYYEYIPVAFTKPQQGWIIKKDTLSAFAKNISQKLELNNRETERLTYEISQAAVPVSSDYLFIGIVNPSEINQKIPLQISPQPEKVYRYHFYVGSAKSNEKVSAPQLKPIERSIYMILELGSYTAK